MTPRYPGAVWMPSGDDQGANNGPTAFSWHEAVTTGTKEDIAGWVSSENACHAFVGEHGDTAQYKEFDRIAYGVLNGNSRGVVTIETWDNLAHDTELTPDGRDANHSEWDDGQCERIADMIAWADVALGIPIRFMGNTRESGHAPHRLGVPQAGGNVQIGFGPDLWTNHPGKECPGDMRVVCLRDVAIPRARVIAAAVRAGKCTWLPVGPVNLPAALARTGGPTPKPPAPPIQEDDDMFDSIQKIGPDGKATGAVYVAGPGYWQPIPTQEYYQVLAGKIVKPVRLVNAREFDLLRDWCSRTGIYAAPKA